VADLADLVQRAAPAPVEAVDTAAAWRRGLQLRRRRRAATVLGVIAIAGLGLTGIRVVTAPASDDLRLADQVGRDEGLPLAVLQRHPGPRDVLPEAFRDLESTPPEATVRLAHEEGGRAAYVFTTQDGAVCLLVVYALPDAGAVSCADDPAQVRRDGGVSVAWSGPSGSGTAALVPDGYTEARAGDQTWLVHSNVVLIEAAVLPIDVELTGPAGTRTLHLPIGSTDSEPGPAWQALEHRCGAAPPFDDHEHVRPPAGEPVVQVTAPAGFQLWTPREDVGFAAEYGTPEPWHLAVRPGNAQRFTNEEGQSFVVTFLVGPQGGLCATLRQAARELDGGRRGEVTSVRGGRQAVLHTKSGSGASLLLWLESDEVMIQILGQDVDEALLRGVADQLEVSIPPVEGEPEASDPLSAAGKQQLFAVEWELHNISPDGRQLTIRHKTGGCLRFHSTHVEQNAASVRIAVLMNNPHNDSGTPATCPSPSETTDLTVELDEPIGSRRLVAAQVGPWRQFFIPQG
jgi:hypothetical protein